MSQKHSPSGRVGKNPPYHGSLDRAFLGYTTSDYCLSCAYFSQSKGHFGICRDKGDGRIYDGTKKGSACILWRLKTELIGLEDERPPEPVVKIIRLKPDQSLGSFIPYDEHRRVERKRPRIVRQYLERPDYSYPSCKSCGATMSRAGFDYRGFQRYRCKSCGHTVLQKEVLVPSPRINIEEGIQPFKLLRYLGRKWWTPAHPVFPGQEILHRSGSQNKGELSFIGVWSRKMLSSEDEVVREVAEQIVVMYSLDWSVEKIQGFFIAKKGIDIPFEGVTGCIQSYSAFCNSYGIGYGVDASDGFGRRRVEEWLAEEIRLLPIEKKVVLFDR